jgi:5-oxoprolinase (ATP-hydrolysing) subunit A
VNRVDLNCDMGESFGVYRLGRDGEIIRFISSANIACGFHAGDPLVMQQTVDLARQHGVAVGAHPGFPDLVGFGRRNLDMTAPEAKACLIYQIGALEGFCRGAGVTLNHVKPHGALYNLAARDPVLATAVAAGVRAVNPDLILVGLAGSELVRAGVAGGLRVAREVFADRNYAPDGSLISRQSPQAIICDPRLVAERVVMMVQEGRVTALDGTELPLEFDTICLHGDTAGAVELAAAIAGRLRQAGIRIEALR